MSDSDNKTGLAMIAAMDEGRVIGHDGSIPWNHKEDMRHFRRVTLGHAVIMGRGTYDSIGKPLAKRRNIVVTRDRDLRLAGCDVCHSLDEAIALARQDDPLPFIIGGAQLYRQALAQATHLYLTFVPGRHKGDTHFPELDPDTWRETERRADAAGLLYVTLLRTRPVAPTSG